MEVAQTLAKRFPGSRIQKAAYGGTMLVYEVDGCWVDARVLEGAALEVLVRTLAVPDARVTIEGTGRKVDYGLDGDRSLRDLRIDRDDDPIAAIWIDGPAEEALVAALWTADADTALLPHRVVESFRYVIADGEVAMRRRTHDDDHLHRAVVAAGMLAARPSRIARSWLQVAHALGGTTTTDRWDLADLGGEFAVTIDRGARPIRVDNLRRLRSDDDDHGGLYTRARTRRIAADGDRWAIWRPDLSRRHRPDAGRGLHPVPLAGLDAVASDPVRLADRLKRHGALLDAAAPTAIATIGDAIELWWPGLVQDPDRVGPAVELLARIATEVGAPVGPYR